MATNGTIGTLNGQWKTTYTVTWSLLSQNIENNTSTIRLTSTLYTGNSTTIRTTDSGFVTDGTTMYSGAYTKSGTGNIFSKTKDITVKHNSDGSFPGRKVNFSAWDYGAFSGGKSGSGTITGIPTIPRANKVSCSSPYIGDTATITIGKKSSSFTSTVTYTIGGLTGTIAEKTTDAVLQLDTEALKGQIYALIPNSKSTSGTITCTTYDGNTQIGNPTTASFNLYAKEEDCSPNVSGVVIDTNEDTIALTDNNLIIVKNASKPKVTINATSKYSSTISNYSISLNDGQISNEQEHTFDTINSNTITVSATDSRGYSKSYTIDLSERIVDYVKLHFNTIELQRTEGTSNEVILNGNGVWYNGQFKENVINTLNCKFYYKESSSSSQWIDGGTITPTIENNIFRFSNISLGNIYNYDKEYQIKIVATDLLMIVGNENKDIHTVEKGQEVVAIGEDTVWINGVLNINDVNVLDLIYPIGSLYLSVNSTNPSTLFGGTWEQIKDRFLLATGDTYAPNTTLTVYMWKRIS